MSREQQMQVSRLCKQQGIKPASKQPSAVVRIAAIKAQLSVNSQPEEGDVRKKEGETTTYLAHRRNRGYTVVTHQALSAKCKEPSWLIGSFKGATKMRYLSDDAAPCVSVLAVQLSDKESITIVKT